MSLLEVNKITPQSGTTLVLGDSGDTINFGSGVLPNFENLTVTGDLTVDTNSLKVDSTNNYVGIGTASPSINLEIKGSGSNSQVYLSQSTNSTYAQIYSDSDGTFIIGADQGNTASGSSIRLKVDSSEAMRIDNSGNLLVDKTSVSYTTVGHELKAGGRAFHTADGGKALTLTRLTSNGGILDFYNASGQEIGTIGIISNDNLYITNPHSNTQKGIGIADDNIYPVDNTGNSTSNQLDIGDSSAQFRNAYFGGTVNTVGLTVDTNTLYVDSTNNRVGVRTTSPSRELDVDGQVRFQSSSSGRYFDFINDSQNSYLDTSHSTIFRTNGATSLGEVMRLGTSNVIINEGSADVDFRVESNNAAHMLFVDGGNDRVGVYTSSPEGRFDTQGTGYFGVQNYSEQATQKALVLRGDGVSGVYAQSRFNFYTQPGTTSNGVAKLHIKSQYGSDAESSELFTFTSNGRLGVGTSTPSSQLHIVGSSTTSQVIIENTDGGAAAAPDLFLYRNSATPADDDVLGNIEFRGKNSTGGETRYVINNTKIVDASAGTEDGQIEWQLLNNGSFQKILTLHPNQVVINEDSLDTDFRVESDNLTHALFVDGANGHVKFYVTRQVPQYAGTFPGATPTTVVDLSSLGTTTNAGVRIRAHGSENSYRNSSYGEWIAVRSLAGGTDHWDLISVAQVVTGNNYGQVVLSMSGSNLQVKNGANAATGSYRISFELFN